MAFHEKMAEALRLTRSGDLMEATALIQRTLGASGPATPLWPSGAGGKTSSEPIVLRPIRPALPQPVDTPAREAREHPGRATFEQRTYRAKRGSTSYWLYRPADLPANPPLVVMLHGCTQSAQDFAAGTAMNALADELGFIVAYPQQSPAANPQKCWNWFKPGDQQRDRGEPAVLAGITREVVAETGADPDRLYVAGLSAGGAAAAIMAAQYPDVFAAVGIHSGLACGAARDLPSALAAMQRGGSGGRTGTLPFVPVITFHGDRDTTVNEANSRQIVAAATSAAPKNLEIRVTKGGSKAGRSYTRAQSVDSSGQVLIEQWTVAGLGHAWSGGDANGTYTDPSGPSASRAMLEFFLRTKRG